jgi:hypothetical protein
MFYPIQNYGIRKEFGQGFGKRSLHQFTQKCMPLKYGKKGYHFFIKSGIM